MRVPALIMAGGKGKRMGSVAGAKDGMCCEPMRKGIMMI